MRTGLIIIAIGTLFGLAVYGIYSQFVQRTRQAPQFELPSPSPQASPTPTPASLPSATPISPAPPTQPQTSISRIGDLGIITNSPSALSKISSPLKVSGFTKIPGREFSVKVKDENGNVLASQIQTNDCDSYEVCPFEIYVSFPQPTSRTGAIEVYSGDFLDQVVVQFN